MRTCVPLVTRRAVSQGEVLQRQQQQPQQQQLHHHQPLCVMSLISRCSKSVTNPDASHAPPGSLTTHSHYQQLLARRAQGSCPALFLAPMENLMDRSTRVSLLHSLHQHGLSAFDEACTEFIRVPAKSENPAATVRGITAEYDADELGHVPLAAQLMGSSHELLAAAAMYLVNVKGAPRIDLNCGCPANQVTGNGAGSSLLRDPNQLHSLVSALISAVGHQVPVSVKMRSGFADTGLFRDNLLALQEAGAALVTVHPRTKQQAYSGRADWSLISLAKQLLSIPVVGNGDVICLSSALSLLQETGCDGIMVGRGALQDPLLFHRIRSHFPAETNQQQHDHQHRQVLSQQPGTPPSSMQQPSVSTQPQQQAGCDEAAVLVDFLQRYAACGWKGTTGGAKEVSKSGRIGRLKKVMKYLFSGQPELRQACEHLLRVQPDKVTPEQLLQDMLAQVQLHWQPGGPSDRLLVSHMSMPGRSKATWQQAAAPRAAAGL